LASLVAFLSPVLAGLSCRGLPVLFRSLCLHNTFVRSSRVDGVNMVSATVSQSAKETYDKLMGFLGPGRMGPVTLALLVDILGMIDLFSKNNANFDFQVHVSGYDTTGNVFLGTCLRGSQRATEPRGRRVVHALPLRGERKLLDGGGWAAFGLADGAICARG